MKGIDDINLRDVYRSPYGTDTSYLVTDKSSDMVEVLYTLERGQKQSNWRLPDDILFREDPIDRQGDKDIPYKATPFPAGVTSVPVNTGTCPCCKRKLEVKK